MRRNHVAPVAVGDHCIDARNAPWSIELWTAGRGVPIDLRWREGREVRESGADDGKYTAWVRERVWGREWGREWEGLVLYINNSRIAHLEVYTLLPHWGGDLQHAQNAAKPELATSAIRRGEERLPSQKPALGLHHNEGIKAHSQHVFLHLDRQR
jgi:hypothetical protein